MRRAKRTSRTRPPARRDLHLANAILRLGGRAGFTRIEVENIKAELRRRMNWRPFRGGVRRVRHGLPENVLGIGFGWKRTERKRAKPNCLRVYVRRKRAKQDMPRREHIPKHLEGIPIDVIEVGRLRTHEGLQSGRSIGDQYGHAGTLGCVVTDGQSRYLLGSWHVMDYQNEGNGSPVYMPAPGQSDNPQGVGQIVASPGITLGPASPYAFDAAIASIADGIDIDPSLPGLGQINATPADLSGPPDQLPGVTFSGCATQGRSGVIEAVSEDVQVMYYGDSTAVGYLTQQIGIVAEDGQPFSQESDSGSLIVTQTTCQPVGILVGGGTTSTQSDVPHTFASPIQVILNCYGISVVC